MFNSDLNVELCWWWANMLISHNYKYATGRGGNTTRGKTKGTNPPKKKYCRISLRWENYIKTDRPT